MASADRLAGGGGSRVLSSDLRARFNGASQDPLETIYPSITPQIIGMGFGNGTYTRMVIESISKPLTNPHAESGVMISCSVQLSLATLTAWDRRGIRASYR